MSAAVSSVNVELQRDPQDEFFDSQMLASTLARRHL